MALPRDTMRALEDRWRRERAAIPPRQPEAQPWLVRVLGTVGIIALFILAVGLVLALIRVALWGFGL